MPRLRKTLKPAAPWDKFAGHIEKVGRKVGRPKKTVAPLGPVTDEEVCVTARGHMHNLNRVLRTLLERHISTEVVRSTENGGPFQLRFTKAL